MKKAKITKPNGYKCAPDGHTVITVPFNTIVDGKIAEWALADKAASAMFDPVHERKIIAPIETKVDPIRAGGVDKGGHNTDFKIGKRPPAPKPTRPVSKGKS